MKTSTLFKTFIVIALAAISGSNLFAQVVVNNAQLAPALRPTYTRTPFDAANYDNSNTEKVTTGAKMPYYVERDASVNGSAFFNASVFKWTWTGITALEDYSTTNAITSATETSSNFVVATMPAAGTSTTISTQEISKPKVGAGCDGTTTTVTITVVDKPTVTMTEASVGNCSPVAQNLSLTLTGTAPFYVDYTISAVGTDGTTEVGTEKTYHATLATAATALIIDPTQLLDVANAADNSAAQTPGKYTVTITKVWDTYSWKAINYDSLAASPLAANDNYFIYVYPTPTTKQIQHIKQL